MNIGIVGSGKIGATAARLFADAGHEVAVSNSRGPESLTAQVEEAADFGEVVLVAMPFFAYEELAGIR